MPPPPLGADDVPPGAISAIYRGMKWVYTHDEVANFWRALKGRLKGQRGVVWAELDGLRTDPDTTGYILALLDNGDASAKGELRGMLAKRLTAGEEGVPKQEMLNKVVAAFEESAHDAMRSPERKAHRDAKQTRGEVRAEGEATRERVTAQGAEITRRLEDLPAEVGEALAPWIEEFRQEQAEGLAAASASGG